MKSIFLKRIGPNLYRYYIFIMVLVIAFLFLAPTVFAASDIWTIADKIIKDVYKGIAGVSTALAGLMSAVAVIGVKMSSNQHKSDQAWNWLKQIWGAWAIINGIGSFISYIVPLFSGLNTLTP